MESSDSRNMEANPCIISFFSNFMKWYTSRNSYIHRNMEHDIDMQNMHIGLPVKSFKRIASQQ